VGPVGVGVTIQIVRGVGGGFCPALQDEGSPSARVAGLVQIRSNGQDRSGLPSLLASSHRAVKPPHHRTGSSSSLPRARTLQPG
jgi:hypothetical protein